LACAVLCMHGREGEKDTANYKRVPKRLKEKWDNQRAKTYATVRGRGGGERNLVVLPFRGKKKEKKGNHFT